MNHEFDYRGHILTLLILKQLFIVCISFPNFHSFNDVKYFCFSFKASLICKEKFRLRDPSSFILLLIEILPD